MKPAQPTRGLRADIARLAAIRSGVETATPDEALALSMAVYVQSQAGSGHQRVPRSTLHVLTRTAFHDAVTHGSGELGTPRDVQSCAEQVGATAMAAEAMPPVQPQALTEAA